MEQPPPSLLVDASIDALSAGDSVAALALADRAFAVLQERRKVASAVRGRARYALDAGLAHAVPAVHEQVLVDAPAAFASGFASFEEETVQVRGEAWRSAEDRLAAYGGRVRTDALIDMAHHAGVETATRHVNALTARVIQLVFDASEGALRSRERVTIERELATLYDRPEEVRTWPSESSSEPPSVVQHVFLDAYHQALRATLKSVEPLLTEVSSTPGRSFRKMARLFARSPVSEGALAFLGEHQNDDSEMSYSLATRTFFMHVEAHRQRVLYEAGRDAADVVEVAWRRALSGDLAEACRITIGPEPEASHDFRLYCDHVQQIASGAELDAARSRLSPVTNMVVSAYPDAGLHVWL